MTTELAAAVEPHHSPEISVPDRAAAVAAGIRDAKAGSTRRTYASAWRNFQAWANARGHQPLPAAPQTVALYLGHLAANGQALASVHKTRATTSHFHAAHRVLR